MSLLLLWHLSALGAEGLPLHFRAKRGKCLVEILVAAAGEAQDDQLALDVVDAGERVGRLEGGDDPLGAGESRERSERLVVGARQVRRAPGVAQPGVLRADARVVEPGGDRVGVCDLSVLVGQHGGARAVQDTRSTVAERCRVRGLDADERHARVVDEAREHPDRVGAAADAGEHRVREPTLGLEHLRARLAPDHGLELADDLRIRRRSDARADHVVRRLDVGDPVADRCARRLLEGARPELDGLDGRAHQPHALDVRRLAAHVLGAHVDDAVEPEARAGRRGRDSVLSCPRLGDDPALAEAARQDHLPERVVDLVRSRVVEILALQVEPLVRREPLRERQGGRPPRVRAAEVVDLRCVRRVVERGRPGGGQLVERRDQRLGHVATSVGAVRLGVLRRRHALAAST